MRVLAFYSFKGGVGKTSAAVNVAAEAARDGVPTLLWDMDPQAAASWILGHDDGLESGAGKLFKGKVPIGREVVPTGIEHLHLLPADRGYRHLDNLLQKRDAPADILAQLLRPLSEVYGLVVLDCPPSFSRLSGALFRVADLLAVPLLPSPLSLRVWHQLRQEFRDNNLPRKRLSPFLSMVDRRRTLHREWLATEPPPVRRQLSTWIPSASQVERMAVERGPVRAYAPRAAVTAAYRNLWLELDRRLSELPQRNPV